MAITPPVITPNPHILPITQFGLVKLIITPGAGGDPQDRFYLDLVNTAFEMFLPDGGGGDPGTQLVEDDTISHAQGIAGVWVSATYEGLPLGSLTSQIQVSAYLAAKGTGTRSTATDAPLTITCAAPEFDPPSLSVVAGADTSDPDNNVEFIPDASATTLRLKIIAATPFSTVKMGANGDGNVDDIVDLIAIDSPSYLSIGAAGLDGSFHGAGSFGIAGCTNGDGDDLGPTTTVNVTVRYNAPVWNDTTDSATVGVAGASEAFDWAGIDDADPPTQFQLTYPPELEVRSNFSGSLLASGTWYDIATHQQLVNVIAHAKGVFGITAKVRNATAATASDASLAYTITASIATETALPTDATRVSNWDFAGALTNPGNYPTSTIGYGPSTEFPGSVYLHNTTNNGWLNRPGETGSDHIWYSSSAQYVWFTGTGIDRGVSIRVFTGAGVYPGGSEVGSGSIGIAFGSLSYYAATPQSIDPQNFWMAVVLTNNVRGYDFTGGDTDEACVFDLNSKFLLKFTPEQLIKIGSTSGGGTSDLYAHAGDNLIIVHSGGASCQIDTYHGGNASVAAVGGSGATNLTVAKLLDNLAGSARFCGRVKYLMFGNTGTRDQTRVDNYKAWFAARFVQQAHTKSLAWLGDSRSQGFAQIPGFSPPGDYAKENPTVEVVTFAFSGVNLAAGTNSVVNAQLPRAITYLNASGAAQKALIFWAGINDIPGGASAANLQTAADAIIAECASNNIGSVACVELIRAVIGASNETVRDCETLLRTFRTTLMASAADAVVDLRGELFPTLTAYTMTGTAATDAPHVRDAVRGLDVDVSTIYGIHDGLDFYAVTSRDGAHVGPYFSGEAIPLIEPKVDIAFAASGEQEVSRGLRGRNLGRIWDSSLRNRNI